MSNNTKDFKLIAHRGNTNRSKPELENNPNYVEIAINQGYDVEIDVWYDNEWWLGHDKPEYQINDNWLMKYQDKLWIHCKNLVGLARFKNRYYNYFWHQNDDFTLTSQGFIWTYPGKELTENSICVAPRMSSVLINGLPNCRGICSDYVGYIEKIFNV